MAGAFSHHPETRESLSPLAIKVNHTLILSNGFMDQKMQSLVNCLNENEILILEPYYFVIPRELDLQSIPDLKPLHLIITAFSFEKYTT
jgi:hypothetical protein